LRPLDDRDPGPKKSVHQSEGRRTRDSPKNFGLHMKEFLSRVARSWAAATAETACDQLLFAEKKSGLHAAAAPAAKGKRLP